MSAIILKGVSLLRDVQAVRSNVSSQHLSFNIQKEPRV